MYDCGQYTVMTGAEFLQGTRGQHPSPVPVGQFVPQHPESDYDRGHSAGMGAAGLLAVLLLAGLGYQLLSKDK